jgi:hypothetical protein
MEAFDLDAFIAQVNNDQSKGKGDPHSRLNKLLMNTRDNQGTVSFLPVRTENTGQFYEKLSRVYEYWGTTSLLDNGEAWYKVLPLESYGELSADDLELYNEVKGYLDHVKDLLDYDEFRVRNYVIFNGILINLKPKNESAKVNEDLKNCPCIFIYPSNNVIDAFGTAINNKIDAVGSKDWIPVILNPSSKGYQGMMQISFNKSTGVGYDCAVAFEINSSFNKVVDPGYEIPAEELKLFDNVIPRFLGWMYDDNNKKLFNTLAFRELRDQLKLYIKQLERESNGGGDQPSDASVTYENKNLESQPGVNVGAKKKVPF